MNSSIYLNIFISKLEMLRDNLNNSIDEINNINNKINSAVCVNGNSVVNANLSSMKNDLISKRDFINNYVLPEARNNR